jgi:hypothetical protein
VTRSRRPRPKVRIIALAAVCCIAVFAALTASASAVVKAGDDPATRVPVVSAQTTDSPSYRAGDTASTRVPVLSAQTIDAPSYRSGDTASLRVPAQGPVYRAGDVASTRVPGSTPTFVSVPSAPHTIVQDNGSQTLAIILASSALGIALAGAGFALLRTRMPKAAGLH